MGQWGTSVANSLNEQCHSRATLLLVVKQIHTIKKKKKSFPCMLSLQSFPTLSEPMDCRLPGSSEHGILQARILEWVAISFSRGSSQSRSWNHVSYVRDRLGRQPIFHTLLSQVFWLLIWQIKLFASPL